MRLRLILVESRARGRTIVLSAERGCPLCKAFVWRLHQRGSAVDSYWELSIGFNKTDDRPWRVVIKKTGENLSWPRAYELTLLPTTYYSSPAQILNEIRFQVDQIGPSPTQLALPVLPSSTGDRRCMAQASAWFKECSENHKRCNQRFDIQTVETLPSRLLAVSPLKVKIVTTAHRSNSNVPVYMTVSHKWRSQMPKLLRCNVKKSERSVNVSELPQLFQDAFNLARALQIPYIWIDALCIIQDDETDKASEISKMDHIYQNAVLNIGATGAADAARPPADRDLVPDSMVRGKGESEMRDHSIIARSTDVPNKSRLRDEGRTNAERCDLPGFVTEHVQPHGLRQGLFADRDPLLYSLLAITVKTRGKEYNCIVYDSSHADDFYDSALFKRGWVLQERLLSPRSLFFGQQMVWECSELVACETFPFGFPLSLMEYNVRLGKILVECSEGSRPSAQYTAWREIVKAFTGCQLTYDLDCFPALSGLAHNFQASLQDEYYAGLWKDDFIPGLCWFRADQESGRSRYPPFPSVYRGELTVHNPASAPPLI